MQLVLPMAAEVISTRVLLPLSMTQRLPPLSKASPVGVVNPLMKGQEEEQEEETATIDGG